ncbi:unnamed protein product [Allacma fusca]|uniref:HSac2 domain-containing protein n=1 Tax=Allacma fusca TaxID=39272 RepID=A0A8J2JQ24_9HEXA|nr:unnamed protein product [Allacma fusca]
MDFRLFSRDHTTHSQALSDEESLEDHSGLEDFQGVTLQLDENDLTSQSQTPGTPYSSSNRYAVENHAKWQEEREALLSNSNSKDGNGVPRISITPMTPPSTGASPTDEHSTVSLNSTNNGSPMYQSNYTTGGTSSNASNQYWRPQSPLLPSVEFEAKEFFAFRDSIIQNVMDEVQSLVDPSLDGSVRGTWLLTEIDHWNNEKERILLLCTKTIVIVKYDFIAMKQEEHRRVYLCIIDTIIQGELKYPERSLTPRLSGIAGGLVGVVKDCIIPSVQGTVQSVGNVVLYRNAKPSAAPMINESEAESNVKPPETDPVSTMTERPNSDGDGGITSPKTSIMSALSLENFEPRSRNVQGVRIMWNQDLPLSFTQKWNPFNKSIPWITFTSHPLLWHKGGGGGINRSFDVDSFSREFIDILSHSGGDNSPCCRVEYKPIIIETYVGLTSLFHNANGLGFYKVRGRISF